MKTLLAIAILLACSTGCDRRAQSSATKPVMKKAAPKTESEIYAELWNKCHAKKLKYEVFCYQDHGCNAEAWDNRLDWLDRRQYYSAHADDPTAAAVQLLSVLDGPTNDVNNPNVNNAPLATFDTGDVKP